MGVEIDSIRFDQRSPAVDHYKKMLSSQPQSFSDHVRIERHKFWIEAAEDTLFNKKTAQEICYKWSDYTDQIVRQVWQYCGLENLELALFAMGKWGARELNLSSDIDFFVVSEHPINQEISKKFKDFLKILNENTSFGFCYRTDIDIRPGGRFGPAISSLTQAQDYYWNSGANWEKVALVRLREICGPPNLIEEFLEMKNQFIYRKYLDYTLFEDLKNLRTKIHHSFSSQNELNIKLTPGGIRDIELFINAIQVIHGGRTPELRLHSTTEAAQAIEKLGLLPKLTASELLKNYWTLRDLENKVQALGDKHTHSLKLPIKSIAGADLTQEIKTALDNNHKIISTLIGFDDDRPTDNEKISPNWLIENGFNEDSAYKVWPEIQKLTALSTRTNQDEKARESFLREFLTALSSRPFGKDLGLYLLKDFIKNTRAKATFFTTLLRDPTLIGDLASIFSASSYIGHFVASRPELIDSLILKRNELTKNDFEDFLIQLAESKKISQIHLVVQFLKDHNVTSLGLSNSQLADDICLQLIKEIAQQLQIDCEIEILALGKWGAQELGLASDLDFIMVTPNSPTSDDYKLARRFLSRLTEQQKSGSLYSYDLRLRPSGNSGPLLVGTHQLIEYLTQHSQAWERQSFLRARPLKPNSLLNNLSSTYIKKGLSEPEENELKIIQSKLFATKFAYTHVDLKLNPGGLTHIELTLQKLILKNKLPLALTSTPSMFKTIYKNLSKLNEIFYLIESQYNYLRFIEQLHQVKSSHSGSTLNFTSESMIQVCHELDLSPEQLFEKISTGLDGNAKNIDRVDNEC